MSYEPKWEHTPHVANPHKDYEKEELSGIEPTTTQRRGSVFSILSRGSTRRFSISDDVFGEITEEGPNYRDVCTSCRCFWYESRLTTIGWVDGDSGDYDQDADWAGSALDSFGVRCIGACAGRHLLVDGWGDDYLGELCGGEV